MKFAEQNQANALPTSLLFHLFLILLFICSGKKPEVTLPVKGISSITVRLISAPQEQTEAIQTKTIKSSDKALKKIQAKQNLNTQVKAELQEAKNDNNGVTIIYQPAPKIPDDLREQATTTFATVRFHVAADNLATAELLVPSQNPRLNHILMFTLKTWKFKAATENGKPIASDFEIRIKFRVE